jgi:SAM-dependent methyltransferase
VLELACGTGQITIPIARDDRPTVGSISRAPCCASRTSVPSVVSATVEFVHSDMRDFKLHRQFNLIIVARNSLLHLLTTDDLLAALACIRRHLAPDGVFAFDIFNPSVRLLARPTGQRFPTMETSTASFGLLRVEGTSDYDSATQVNHGTWYVSTPDRKDAWTFPLVLRSIFPQELPLLLSAPGLALVRRFGELSRAPLGPGSRIQACLCRRQS